MALRALKIVRDVIEREQRIYQARMGPRSRIMDRMLKDITEGIEAECIDQPEPVEQFCDQDCAHQGQICDRDTCEHYLEDQCHGSGSFSLCCFCEGDLGDPAPGAPENQPQGRYWVKGPEDTVAKLLRLCKVCAFMAQENGKEIRNTAGQQMYVEPDEEPYVIEPEPDFDIAKDEEVHLQDMDDEAEAARQGEVPEGPLEDLICGDPPCDAEGLSPISPDESRYELDGLSPREHAAEFGGTVEEVIADCRRYDREHADDEEIAHLDPAASEQCQPPYDHDHGACEIADAEIAQDLAENPGCYGKDEPQS
jgi:hypothetical protein